MNTSSSESNPTDCRILSNSFPALPTNGLPCLFSSEPGASPMITSLALGLPRLRTIFVPACASGSSRMCFISSNNSSSEAYLVSVKSGILKVGATFFIMQQIEERLYCEFDLGWHLQDP